MQVSFRPILYVIGLLLVGLAVVMIIPALADFSVGNPDWTTFVAAAVFTVFIGGALALGNRDTAFNLNIHEGFVLTTAAWLAVVTFGALPFLFAHQRLAVTDAFFESMSGFTTTGSTVLTGLDDLPPGLLLWRSLSQWIGGMGIVGMAVVMLPFLRVGGMQLFHTESSDRSEKLFPRAAELATWIGIAYLCLTLLCAIAYKIAGMGWFDAWNHAMTTLATGGFSTKDASIGFFNNPDIEWIAIVFMISGALPLIAYVRAVREGVRSFLADEQIWRFVAILLAAIAAMTLWVWLEAEEPFAEALRLAAFNVTSIITDTGFATADFGKWGSFAVGAFFIFYFVGGCAGSTAGAIKIFRWQVLFISVRAQFRTMRRPHEVIVATYSGRRLPHDLIVAVINFFFLYVVVFTAFSLALTAVGVDFLSAVSGVAQAMANAGPGLGEIIGPAGNFATLPDAAKWLLAFAMLLGRLELFTVLVLFVPSFWHS